MLQNTSTEILYIFANSHVKSTNFNILISEMMSIFLFAFGNTYFDIALIAQMDLKEGFKNKILRPNLQLQRGYHPYKVLME